MSRHSVNKIKRFEITVIYTCKIIRRQYTFFNGIYLMIKMNYITFVSIETIH